MNKMEQYSLVETSRNQWPKNESDLADDDKYLFPILKHDENQNVLVEQKEGTLMEEAEG